MREERSSTRGKNTVDVDMDIKSECKMTTKS